MASHIELTAGTEEAAGTQDGVVTQPLSRAVDVARFDRVDLVSFVAGLEGDAATPIVQVLTGMHADTEDGWVVLGAFAANGTPGTAEKVAFEGLLNYLRWRVTGLGTGRTLRFSVEGMGRGA